MNCTGQNTLSPAQKLELATKDPNLCKVLLERLVATLDGRQMRFMEVCGSHTVAIFQSGLRSMLPANITHVSGPGCPVCVTHEAEVELFLQVAHKPNVLIATFGDLLRIPGQDGLSLKHGRANGAHVEIVYSPLDAIELAAANPARNVVFLGVGFETTAPTVAAAIITARKRGMDNFSVLSMHKLVPPALAALIAEKDFGIDAFLLPGHVATVTGLAPFAFLAEQYAIPAAVSGFEPVDLLLALCVMADQLVAEKPIIANTYHRAVNNNGNPQARKLLAEVFTPVDALWRGLGLLPRSGLAINEKYADFDAMKELDLYLPEIKPLHGCMCGSVLKGRITPAQCPMFGKKCTPQNPVGPCMVSTEGSCAAHYRYGENQ